MSRRGLGGMALASALLGAGVKPAAANEPANVRLGVEDRLGIMELFANFVWAYDCSDLSEFLSLFTEDALVVGRGTFYQGKEELAGWLHYLLGLRENEGDDIWMHEAGQFRFEGTSPVIVYAYATHFNGNTEKSTRGVRSLGYFVSECVKTETGWKFSRFSVTSWDRTTLPWKKSLPWADSNVKMLSGANAEADA